MGLRAAGRHDHAVELVLFDDLLHLILGILGTGKQILLGMDDVGQLFGIFGHPFDIHHTGDVHPAVADEYPHPGILVDDIDFLRNFHAAGQRIAGRSQTGAGGTGGRTGLGNGAGNVFGFLEYAAGVDTGPRGFDRRKGL